MPNWSETIVLPFSTLFRICPSTRCVSRGATIALTDPAHAVKLTGVTSYAYNVNNLGGPDHADSGLFCYWHNTNQISTGTILQAVKYVNGVPYETFSVRHLFDGANTKYELYMADEAGNSVTFQTIGVVKNNSVWHQIGMLLYPAAGNARISIDGVGQNIAITHQTGLSFNLPVAGQTWTVGATGTPTGPLDFYSGNLDQVYFHAWDGVYDQVYGMFTEACGQDLGTVFAPIRPGPLGAYIVRDFGNPVPIIMLQGKDAASFLFNQGGASSFSGGQGMSTSPTDPFILYPLQ